MDILVRTPERVALGLAERDFFLTDVFTHGATLFHAPSVKRDRDG
jgi:hypothetical protein